MSSAMRSRRSAFRIFPLVVLLLSISGCAGDSRFFVGKTVTIVVPHGPGSMDQYARAFAPYLQKYLKGARVEVVDMPGEGTILGKNAVFAAKPDGLTLGFSTAGGGLLAEWGGDTHVAYRTAEFRYVGRINAEPHILVVSDSSRLEGVADIIRRGRLSLGFPGIGSDDYYVARITSSLLGFAMDERTSFSSLDSLLFACAKGEIDGTLLSASNVIPLVEAGTVVPLAVFSESRAAALPAVPTILEAAPSGQAPLLRSILGFYELDRTLFGPPGIPAGRLEVLRGALDRAMADPEFLDGMRRVRRPVDYLPGVETERILAGILAEESRIRPLVRAITAGNPQ